MTGLVSFWTNVELLTEFLTSALAVLQRQRSCDFCSLLLMFVRHDKVCTQKQKSDNCSAMFTAFSGITGYFFLTEIQNNSQDSSLNFNFKVRSDYSSVNCFSLSSSYYCRIGKFCEFCENLTKGFLTQTHISDEKQELLQYCQLPDKNSRDIWNFLRYFKMFVHLFDDFSRKANDSLFNSAKHCHIARNMLTKVSEEYRILPHPSNHPTCLATYCTVRRHDSQYLSQLLTVITQIIYHKDIPTFYEIPTAYPNI